jgi:hypothetical protein
MVASKPDIQAAASSLAKGEMRTTAEEAVDRRNASGWWARFTAHVLMFFVASSFGGYNVLLAGITNFPKDMTLRQKYCA